MIQKEKSLPEGSPLMLRKHYPRVVWSMCVLGNKEELSRVFPICQDYFSSSETEPAQHDTLNFYYCFLILKTYFPTPGVLKLSSILQDHLGQKTLQSMISETHELVYNQIVECGVACLKEFNINNLMCDIFIPKYISSDGRHEISNLIIDVHGYHHFMRNGNFLKGGSALKAKILTDDEYIYQYISVDEWAMADDKSKFIFMLLDHISA